MAIHPTAVLEPGSQVDPSRARVGPYVVIGAGVPHGPG